MAGYVVFCTVFLQAEPWPVAFESSSGADTSTDSGLLFLARIVSKRGTSSDNSTDGSFLISNFVKRKAVLFLPSLSAKLLRCWLCRCTQRHSYCWVKITSSLYLPAFFYFDGEGSAPSLLLLPLLHGGSTVRPPDAKVASVHPLQPSSRKRRPPFVHISLPARLLRSRESRIVPSCHSLRLLMATQ